MSIYGVREREREKDESEQQKSDREKKGFNNDGLL
jgi:hypothetical protein